MHNIDLQTYNYVYFCDNVSIIADVVVFQKGRLLYFRGLPFYFRRPSSIFQCGLLCVPCFSCGSLIIRGAHLSVGFRGIGFDPVEWGRTLPVLYGGK